MYRLLCRAQVASILLAFLLAGPFLLGSAEKASAEEPSRAIFIGGHPDDADVGAAGTAALFAEMGHEVKFVSLTNGDAGHHEEGGGILAQRRNAEAQEAGRRLGIEYEVLDYHDGKLQPTLELRKDVIRLIREWEADIVVAHRPNDYHPDHRATGEVVQDAAYMVQVPNVVPFHEPLDSNPVFLYFEDGFERPNPFRHDIVVAIDEVVDQKVAALDAHESQMYEWLPWIGGYEDEVPDADADRREWLRERWIQPAGEEALEGVREWYGSDHVDAVNYTESFEIAEYGHQPTEEEIRQLFPMLSAE